VPAKLTEAQFAEKMPVYIVDKLCAGILGPVGIAGFVGAARNPAPENAGDNSARKARRYAVILVLSGVPEQMPVIQEEYIGEANDAVPYRFSTPRGRSEKGASRAPKPSEPTIAAGK
jgi:hypothetical protein